MPFPSTQHDLSRARHDLRTVVNHLEGYVTLLREGDDVWVQQPEADSLLTVVSQGARSILASLEPKLRSAAGAASPDPFRALQAELRPICVLLGDSLSSLQKLEGEGQTHPDVARLLIACARLRSFVETGSVHGSNGTGADQQPTERDGTNSPVLLIVEEDGSHRDLYTRMFSRLGYRVSASGGGSQALHYARQVNPDVVLLDLARPDASGALLLGQIRQAVPLAPVIVLSGLVEPGAVQCFMDAGAEDFLAKPFFPVLLRARVAAALDRKRYRELLAGEQPSAYE